METMRRISKRYYLRQVIACVLSCWMLLGMPTRMAFANPYPDADVVPNSLNVLDTTVPLDWTGSSGLDAVIGTATGNNVITWDNFDIGYQSSVTFTQNGGWVLNDVHALDGMATGIRGGLTAQNCGLIVKNPLGVVFGPYAIVEAQSFAAVALSMDLDEFVAQGSGFDPLNFAYGPVAESEPAYIWLEKSGSHYATIKVNETLALIGKEIINKGKIYTNQPGAYVLMAAGEEVLIGRQNGAVVVDVSSSGDNQNWVKNEGYLYTDDADEKVSLVLAAGDIYSTAIKDVESLRATAVYDAEFDGAINVEAEAASDAVAEVVISTGNNLLIDEDITAEATGNGVDDAYATIDISSGGDLTIKSKGSNGTTLLAEATDGANNTAKISLEAEGAFAIDAPDQVTVQAEADSDCYDGVLNQANVDITAGSVLITGTDYGQTDAPATVLAYAHDATVNRAGVDIQSKGDVEIIGAGSNGDSAIVEALAQRGSESYADVVINAAGDVDIIAKEGQPTDGTETTEALVVAKATDADVLNDAGVEITAGGDVTVKSEGGNYNEWKVQDAYWTITVKKDAYYHITVKKNSWPYNSKTYDAPSLDPSYNPYWGYSYHSHEFHDVQYKTYDTEHWYISSGWGYYSDVYHEAVYNSSFTPYVASVQAIAENAGSSNTATVDITAGGDAVVLAKDGGEAFVEAYAGNALDSVNTANVNITALDGYVLVHAIGGQYSTCQGFTASEASVEATAEYAGPRGDADSSNSASITLVARDVVEEPADTDTDTDLDVVAGDSDDDSDCKDGDVMVIGVEGGKAEVEAKAMYGGDNSASVDVDADSDVQVIALCKEQPSEAEIMALAKYAYNNTADVTIVAGDDVEVKAEDRGEAEIEAIAKDGDVSNTATIDITAGQDVKVIADGWRTEAAIAALADPTVLDTDDDADEDTDDEVQGPVNTAGITIAAGDDVKVIADDGEAGITADTSCGQSNTSTIGITALDDVKVIGKDGGEAEIAASAEKGNTNTADVAIDAGGDVKVIAACQDRSSEASITAEAQKGSQNNASIELGGAGHKIGGDVLVLGKYGGEAEIKAKAEKGNTNTSDILICTEGELTVLGKYGGDAEIKAKAEKGEFNTASVRSCADSGILVKGECGGDAEILAGAYEGFTNTAKTMLWTNGDLAVIGVNGYAGIGSEALDGYTTDAFTSVCAQGDVLVVAGLDPYEMMEQNPDQMTIQGSQYGMGGEAFIYSEAGSEGRPAFAVDQVDVQQEPQVPPTATARTVAVSHQGSVVVADITGYGVGEAGILAEAHGAYQNTASVGVAAGADLTPSAVASMAVDYEGLIPPGNVVVSAMGPGSDARIMSYAHNGMINTADTVICAPGEVSVTGSGERSIAKIKAWAMDGEDNIATTQVYASDVTVQVQGLYMGNGIGAWAGGSPWVHVDSEYCLTEDGAVAITDGQSTLIIDSYANRQDCPTCPPCPCEEPGGGPLTPAAPLYTETGQPLEKPEFEQGGCPALMQWFADEVGLPLDQIHVMLSNADFLATDVQPCDACARLKQQSDAMASLDAAQVDAWAGTVRAGLVGPITPEMMDGIRTALADNPAAMGFDEAAAQYVKILTEELGLEQADAVAVVTGNYAPNYADLGAYIGARTSGM